MFNARKWAEGEIDVMMDGYGNDEAYAVQFILEQLRGDEYRDELTDRQRDAAVKYLMGRKRGNVANPPPPPNTM